jgi:hypothetical protein
MARDGYKHRWPVGAVSAPTGGGIYALVAFAEQDWLSPWAIVPALVGLALVATCFAIESTHAEPAHAECAYAAQLPPRAVLHSSRTVEPQ